MTAEYIQSDTEASLTYERAAQVVRYNSVTGDLTRLTGTKRGKVINGLDSQGYLKVFIDGRYYQAHRVAWLLTHREWPKSILDHRDRNKTNNALDNLRAATFSQNNQNTKMYRSNKSGLKGVIDRGGKFVAVIHIKKKQKYLGTFSTKALAHCAYVTAAKEHYGEFARISSTTEDAGD